MWNAASRQFFLGQAKAASSVASYFLYTWGYNSNGQLGLGNTTTYTTPQKVGSDLWLASTHGSYFGGAIKSDGTLWTWGANGLGQLGLGDTTQRNSPTQVGSGSDWKFISFGHESAFGIKTDGTLWSWGSNGNGVLGLGNTTNYDTPQQVGSDSDWKFVSCGWQAAAAIKENGDLYTWGQNYLGELGQGDTTQRSSPQKLGSDSWSYIAIGSYHMIGVKENGTLWSWGYNANGQLGLGNTTTYTTPQQVGSDTNWTSCDTMIDFAFGRDGSFGLKTNGTLWSWGYNGSGQLGLGNTTTYNSPQQVGSDTNWNSVRICTSAFGVGHTIATKTNGTIWTCGNGGNGELGLGSTTSYNTFQQVGLDTDWTLTSVGSGSLQMSSNLKAATWTPSELGSSLLAWFKADAISGLSNGSVVATWADSSSNNRNYTQTDNNRRPTYQTNIQNSLPIVRFATDWLDRSTGFIHANGNSTIVSVSKPSSNTTGYLIGDGTTFDYYVMRYGSNTVFIEYGYNNISDFVQGSSTSVDPTKFQIHLVNDTGSALSSSVNGSSLSSATSYTRGSLDGTITSRIGLRAGSVSNAWNGDVGEIVVCSVLSGSDRQKLEGYLAHKWGLTSDLPANHPYKSNPPTLD